MRWRWRIVDVDRHRRHHTQAGSIAGTIGERIGRLTLAEVMIVGKRSVRIESKLTGPLWPRHQDRRQRRAFGIAVVGQHTVVARVRIRSHADRW